MKQDQIETTAAVVEAMTDIPDPIAVTKVPNDGSPIRMGKAIQMPRFRTAINLIIPDR